MRVFAILSWSIIALILFSSLGLAERAHPSTGWAVGDDGVILATSNGGATWVRQKSGTTVKLKSACLINPQVGFVVGDQGLALRTTDAGQTWQSRILGNFDCSYVCVHFADAKHGWIGVEVSAVLQTLDGGLHWKAHIIRPLSLAAGVRDLSFADRQAGLAVGAAGPEDAPAIMRTHDGGKTWRIVEVKADGKLALLSVSHPTREKAWAVGSQLKDFDAGGNGTIFFSSDGGLNWTIQWTHKHTWLYNIHFIDAQTGWATGYAGTWAKPIVLTTNDGGKHWKPRQVPGKGILVASYLADRSTGWVVGSDGFIARTGDFGRTWQQQDSAVRSTLRDVCFLAATSEKPHAQPLPTTRIADEGKMLVRASHILVRCNRGASDSQK